MQHWEQQELPFMREPRMAKGTIDKLRRQREKYRMYERANREVLLDFDGTLCQWAYPDMGEPTHGAREAVAALREMGLRVVVWSSRMAGFVNTPDEIVAARAVIVAWLGWHQIPYDEVDEGLCGKRLAGWYVDDKGVGFRGSWPAVVQEISRMRPETDARMARTKEALGVDSGD